MMRRLVNTDRSLHGLDNISLLGIDKTVLDTDRFEQCYLIHHPSNAARDTTAGNGRQGDRKVYNWSNVNT
jgi:hypothetical protein